MEYVGENLWRGCMHVCRRYDLMVYCTPIACGEMTWNHIWLNCGQIRNKHNSVGYRKIPSSDKLSLCIINMLTNPCWESFCEHTFVVSTSLSPCLPSIWDFLHFPECLQTTGMVLFDSVWFHVFVQTAVTIPIEKQGPRVCRQERTSI